MHGRFQFKKLAKYPHMKPADVVIWGKFLEANPDFFDTVDYDFHVGQGADFLPTGEDTPDGRENRLYQRKIDVVGYISQSVWLVEVKPVADMFALGQILTYNEFILQSGIFIRDPKLLVICAKIMNEMKAVYSKFDIGVMVV